MSLVISKEYKIIAGHTRYKAAKKLGLAKVPCVIADDLEVQGHFSCFMVLDLDT